MKISLLAKLVAVFVAVGPIYWIPGVPPEPLAYSKVGLFIVIAAISLLHLKKDSKISIPGGQKMLLPLFGILLLTFPNMFNSQLSSWLYRAQSIIQVAVFLFSCGVLNSRDELENTARLSARLFFSFAAVCLLIILIDPTLPSPLNEGLTISSTGLGGSRTGWSPTMATFLPWAYSGQALSHIALLVASAALITNQFIVQGRTGIVATVLAILAWGVISKKIKVFLVAISILAGIVAFVSLNQEFTRFDFQDITSIEGIDSLSTGRLQQYSLAAELLTENPLTGNGIDQFKYGDSEWNLHNEIAKIAIESGIPAAILVIYMLVTSIKRGVKGAWSGDTTKTAAVLTLISAVIVSFFEPEVFFGSFNKGAIIWLSIAICAATRKTKHSAG